MGKIEALCISVKRGTEKKPVSAAEFKADWGIVGDAHAGNWHRQVSLLEIIKASCKVSKITLLSSSVISPPAINPTIPLTKSDA